MADQLLDKPTLINLALNGIGSYAVYSTDASDELAEKCNAAWRLCLGRCFGLHDWSDFRRTSKLGLRAGTPDNGWLYRFDLSGDRLGPPLKLTRDAACRQPLRDFTLEDGSVFANVPEVWAREKVYKDPEYWIPPFVSAFCKALEGYLAVPVSHDTDLQAECFREAFGTPSQGGTGGMFGRLVAQDRAGEPMGTTMTDAEPLGAAHAAGAAYPWYGRN